MLIGRSVLWNTICFWSYEDYEVLIDFLAGRPLPPFPYRLGVYRVMAVRVKPQAMPEGGLPRELGFGHALDIVNELAVSFLQLSQHFRKRKIPFLFRHLSIEGIEARIWRVTSTSCRLLDQVLRLS